MTLLKKGDKIRLENGMHIYAKVPENVIFSNRIFSNDLYETEICISNLKNS